MRHLRILQRHPGFHLFAALTLALGIGANLAIFTVVRAVLLKPLPDPDSDRIVAVTNYWKNLGRIGNNVSGPDYQDWRTHNSCFQAIGSLFGGEIGIQLPSGAEFISAYFVDDGFFKVFQVRPILGHLLEGSNTALISEGLWKRGFGADASVLGRTIKIENRMLTIVGVLPEPFHYPLKTEIWAPGRMFPGSNERSANNYRAVALLKFGVSVEQAQTEMSGIASRLEAQYPKSNKDKGVAVTLLRDYTVRRVKESLWLLMGAVAVVLLIACANVSGLLLARGAGRTRELAVRAALGATRARLIRQLLAENAVLAFLGAIGGFLLAQALLPVFLRLAPADMPRLAEVRLDGWVLAFLAGSAALATFLAGIAPALQSSRTELVESLKQGAMRGLVGGSSLRIRRILTTAEVALSCALLIASLLFARSLFQLNRVDLGFQPSRLLVMYAAYPADSLEAHKRAGLFFRDLRPELAAIPGVQSVSAAMGLPFGQYGSDGGYIIEGRPLPASSSDLPQAGFRLATPGFFQSLGVPLKAGRDFTDADRLEAPFTCIVNQALVRQSFPNEDPIGKRMQVGLDSQEFMTIVGVVADVRHNDPAKAASAEIYMPHLQHPFYANEMQVVLKTSVDPSSLAAAARDTVRRLNPEVAVRFTTMDAMVSEATAVPRFRYWLIALFAIVAVMLAAAGVYAVVAQRVAQRTAEIGLRMSLGASKGDVLSLVFRDLASIAAPGLALGLLLAVAASRSLSSLLFEVRPLDASVYAASALALLVLAILAAAIPARRALQVDPVTALRMD